MLLPSDVFRASRLDEFRRYQSGETFTGEDYTREMYVSYLTDRAETAKMAAGTAVHKALELAADGELTSWEQFGWKIFFDLDGELALPLLREIPLSRVHNGTKLVGRVDSITATSVRDIKTTAAFDAERYAESYQWRAYLWMSGRQTFVYNLLKAKVDEDEMTVTITDHIVLRFDRYPALSLDVETLIDEYAEAIRRLGILDLEAVA